MSDAIKSTVFSRRTCRHAIRSHLFSVGLLILLTSPEMASRARPKNDRTALSFQGFFVQDQEPATPKGTEETRPLESGKPLERELTLAEAHSYKLTLAASQYAEVAVEQYGINVAVTVFDAAGNKIVEADENGIGENESVSLATETAATYRLEVRPADKNVSKGRYLIKLKELRASTAQDKNLITAERLIDAGLLLQRQRTPDFLRQAADKYQQAIPLCQEAKAPIREATALYLLANVHILLGEKQKALDFSNRALALAQEAAKQGDEERRRAGLKAEANTFDVMGNIYIEFGDKKKALEVFNQALTLRREAGDRVGEVGTLNNVGMAYGYMGEWAQSLDFFNQSRIIVSELRDRVKEAALLNNMCTIHSSLGEYKKALDLCQQALSIRREMNDVASEAIVLNNMGNSYSDLGEYQKALDLYTQALTLHKRVGNAQSQAIALSNIGYVYGTLGEYQKAVEIFNEALALVHAAGDQYREANVLSNIAVNYASMKDFRKALEINQQTLTLRRAVNNREGEAITLNNIAGCYSNLGDKQKALDYYNQSIALHRAIGNPRQLASALKSIGTLYRELGETQKALDYFHEGLQMTRAIGDQNNEAAILAQIARLERDRGNLVEAKSRIEEALAAVESLRVNIKSQQLRASFFASVRNYHELDIDLLMRLHKQRPSEGFDAAALQASEKGRARSLLEQLTEANAEIRQGVDPNLLERERVLRQSISEKANNQMRLLSGKHTDAEATSANKEIDGLAAEYEQLQARIRETSPRYAALTQPVPLSLEEIQSVVLDDETLLLEYALGEERSFLWAVTPKSISSFELPKREDIEEAARHVYELLTARNQTVANETAEQRHKRIEQADQEYAKAALALSRMLLGPAAPELKNKRLLIVVEGMLQYIPFAALPEPSSPVGVQSTEDRAGANNSLTLMGQRPLILGHEIINLPSASVLSVLRREAAGRKSGEKSVAVFADPVFESADPRIAAAPGKRGDQVREAQSPAEIRRSAAESGLEDFVRLRFSRQEADSITRLALKDKRLEALDFDANRTAAASPSIGQYRFLHFATHALINNQHPELSGVVLSLFDREGRPQNGFLRLYDIYNLKLDADLVVLSACRTALGREVKGEGLVGLTRGFMYAGSPRVVATLWQIDDRATAELMKRFYEGMLVQGLRPASALRAAQASMSKDSRWNEPHYWAAFTLQGEWR